MGLARTLTSSLEAVDNRAYHSLRTNPLLVFCLCGLLSVFIDLDHLVAPLFKVARPLHIPFLVVIWSCCFGYGTYLYRCVHRVGLKGFILLR